MNHVTKSFYNIKYVNLKLWTSQLIVDVSQFVVVTLSKYSNGMERTKFSHNNQFKLVIQINLS